MYGQESKWVRIFPHVCHALFFYKSKNSHLRSFRFCNWWKKKCLKQIIDFAICYSVSTFSENIPSGIKDLAYKFERTDMFLSTLNSMTNSSLTLL